MSVLLWLLKNTITPSKARRNKRKKAAGRKKSNKKSKSTPKSEKKSKERQIRKKKPPLAEDHLAGAAPDIENDAGNTENQATDSWSDRPPADQAHFDNSTVSDNPSDTPPISGAGTAQGEVTGTQPLPQEPSDAARNPAQGSSTEGSHHVELEAACPPARAATERTRGSAHRAPQLESPRDAQGASEACSPAEQQQEARGQEVWSATSTTCAHPRKSNRSPCSSERVSLRLQADSTVELTDASKLTSTLEQLAWDPTQTTLPPVAGHPSKNPSARPTTSSKSLCPCGIQSHVSTGSQQERDAPNAPFKFGFSIETILCDRVSDTLVQLWEVTQSVSENTVRPLAQTAQVAIFFRHASKASHPSRQGKISSSRMLVQGLDDRISSEDPRRFRAWELNYESSVSLAGDRRVGGLGEFGAGFVSPVVDIDARATWRYDIENFFDVLSRNYRLAPSAACGTHYFVLPSGGWTLETLKNLARAIVHFEEAIREILPLDRTSNPYCLPNYGFNPRFRVTENAHLEDSEDDSSSQSSSFDSTPEHAAWDTTGSQHDARTLTSTSPASWLSGDPTSTISPSDATASLYSSSDTECSDDAPILVTVHAAMKLVDQCEDVSQLKMLMNAPALGFDEESGLELSEYYAWDFTNITDALNNPVIFRAPPAVTNAADCKSWAEVAVTFVSAAIKADPVALSGLNRDRDALFDFLKSKKMGNCSLKGSWKRLFVAPVEDDLSLISPTAQSELVWQTMCDAAEVQRLHCKQYEVLDMQKTRANGRRSGQEAGV